MVSDLADARILIAEDEEASRLILCEMLANIGVKHCYDAENGLEAIKHFAENPVDLVITDWNMQPMDGLALSWEIRKLKNGPRAKTPIIVLTGIADHNGVLNARQLGISQVLAKPVTQEELAARMRIALHEPVNFVRRGNIYVAERDCKPALPPLAEPVHEAEHVWKV